MCTSARGIEAYLLRSLAGTVLLALFGAVYELFSHGVYSYHMIYAFAIPLGMGVIPYTLLVLRRKNPSLAFLHLWSAAMAVLGVGCAFQGVLDIYGTTNRLVIVYPVAGGALAAAALLSVLWAHRRRRQ